MILSGGYGSSAYGGISGTALVPGFNIILARSNLTSQYLTDSLKITERLQNKSNSCTFTIVKKSGDTAPQQGSSIVIEDTFRTPSKLFSGFITQTQPREVGKGELIEYEIEATDYTYLLNNREAQKAYTGQTMKAIVEDLLSLYASDQSFDTANVATGPTLASITFDHISLRACFEKIAKRTGYVWWVDYDRQVYFQLPTATAAPEDIRDSDSSNHEEVEVEHDTTQVRNSVIVLGSENGEASQTTRTETFTADGETRSWQLQFKPDSIVSIKLDGVAKQFSLDLNERDTDDLVYNFAGAQVRVASGGMVPTNGQEIEVVYYPRIPIIVKRQDSTSIATYAAFEGGDGIHEHTIRETSITSKSEARDRADQELAEFAEALVKGRFRTRSDILQAASVFAPGQALTVNLPTWGIDSDTAYLIQEVTITLSQESTTDIVYHYDVRFGGKAVGVQEFLEALASQEEDTSDTNEVKTIFLTADRFAIGDQTPTHAKYTPPSQVGPGGSPQARVNLSEVS